MKRYGPIRTSGAPEALSPDSLRGQYLQMVLLVVVAVALRAFRLSGQSLWIDEMITLRAANIGGQLGLREALSNIQGPLHTYVIHLLTKVSTAEWVLRLPSVVTGVALIPVVYLLGRDLAGRRAGFIAASIATVSPFAIWYSQEVRNYSFLMFFSAVSSLLAWRILTGKSRRWITYVLSSSAAFYSNLSAVFLIVGQNLFALGGPLRAPGLLRRWVVAVAFILILFAPIGVIGVAGWLRTDDVAERVTLAPLAEEGELLRGATTFTPMAIPYSIFTMIYGYSLGPSARELHLTSPFRAYTDHIWLVAPAGLAGLWALVSGLMDLYRRRRALWYVSCIVLAPLAGATILALFNVKPFNVRYVGVMFPILMVVLGAGIARMRRTGTLLWGALVLFCLVSAWGYYFDPRYAREDIRGVARYVAEHEAPGDVVLVPVVPHLFSFYFEGEADRSVIFKGQARTAEDIASSVQDAAAGHGRLWFVDSRLWFIDQKRMLPAYLDAHYPLLDRREFAGAAVTLYGLEGQSADEAGPGAQDRLDN